MGNSSSQETESKRSSISSTSPQRKRESAALKSLQQVQGEQIPTPNQDFDKQSEQDKPKQQKEVQELEQQQQRHQHNTQPSELVPIKQSSTTDEEFVEHVEDAPIITKSPDQRHEHHEHHEHQERVKEPEVPSAPQAPQPPAPVPTTAESNTSAQPEFMRRKSAIVLETEDEVDHMQRLNLDNNSTEEGTPVRQNSNSRLVTSDEDATDEGPKFDCRIEWTQGGRKVYVTGSFTGWRKMIQLTRQEDGNFSIVLKLPIGTHRLRFVVDNEMKCSDNLPTATDSMGNFQNYVVVDQNGVQMPYEEDKYEEYLDDEELQPAQKLEYCQEIPDVFTDPEVMDKFVSSEFVTPPHLPPHLEGVILNSNSTEKDNNSILPIPNHVVLNHLATTSIKHNVLAVASISRYSRKYVTQVLYAPL